MAKIHGKTERAIVEAYKRGDTVKTIVKRYKVSALTVYAAIGRNGVPQRHSGKVVQYHRRNGTWRAQPPELEAVERVQEGELGPMVIETLPEWLQDHISIGLSNEFLRGTDLSDAQTALTRRLDS